MLIGCTVSGPGIAQTRGVRDTATSYGARLNAKGQPQDLSRLRLNNRVNSRLDNRLSLRLERFRVSDGDGPVAAYRGTQDDGSRRAAVATPAPTIDPDLPQ